MLDLAWSEIALVAVVALVVIGPKDLPGAIRGVADLIKKAKKQIASFQQQADELVREAKLDDVRNQIAEVKGTFNEIRNFDLKGEITKHVDGDGTLSRTFSENPLSTTPSVPAWTPPPTARDTEDAPAMIPPQTMAPYKPPAAESIPTAADAPDAPSFVPPATPAPPAPATPAPAVAEVQPEPVLPPALATPRST
jgi:sec-independent protein translocase protein TatB